MTDDLRDWPLKLAQNAAVCELARSLFEARGQFYKTQCVLTEQPAHIRERYVTLAHEILQKMTPPQREDVLMNYAAGLARATFATGLKRDDKVIGSIHPQGD